MSGAKRLKQKEMDENLLGTATWEVGFFFFANVCVILLCTVPGYFIVYSTCLFYCVQYLVIL